MLSFDSLTQQHTHTNDQEKATSGSIVGTGRTIFSVSMNHLTLNPPISMNHLTLNPQS